LLEAANSISCGGSVSNLCTVSDRTPSFLAFSSFCISSWQSPKQTKRASAKLDFVFFDRMHNKAKAFSKIFIHDDDKQRVTNNLSCLRGCFLARVIAWLGVPHGGGGSKWWPGRCWRSSHIVVRD
jgi:hypothetical protein